MTSSAFNGQFRPLVASAWAAQCALTGRDQGDRTARDRWYRDVLMSCCGVRTTKGATEAQQKALLTQFSMLSKAGDRTAIDGWSAAQNARFSDLAAAAWQCQCRRGYEGTYHEWIDHVLADAGVFNRRSRDRKGAFDKTMASLAVTANDTYWIKRTAEAGETRLRWQIEQFLSDLSWLRGESLDWRYVWGIWDQANGLPTDISEAPIPQLVQVLQMLDTHVRRECRKRDIRPSDIPRRSATNPAPVLILESAATS